ncbi:MAG: hypothetical protein KDD60_00905 [Bdellovibrionales bacterium]|nr:hypothetical protein [Bdellovibrionales bacterium]
MVALKSHQISPDLSIESTSPNASVSSLSELQLGMGRSNWYSELEGPSAAHAFLGSNGRFDRAFQYIGGGNELSGALKRGFEQGQQIAQGGLVENIQAFLARV